MSFRLTLTMVAGALVACSGDDIQARGRLANPVALVSAPSSAEGALDGRVIFVASADDAELRAFLPGDGLFVRGPNAVSPLSIPTAFRPQRLAAGAVEGRGFVVAAGSDTSVVTVSSDTFRVTVASGDEAACAASTRSPSCLGEPALDVSAAADRVVAALGRSGAATGGLALFTPVVEDGAPVLQLDEVIALDFAPASVTLSSDATRAWLADAGVARVVEIALSDGAATPIATAGPVRRLVEVPAYTDANGVARPTGEFLLAVLADGRVQTLDPAAAAPAADPVAAGEPLAPLSVFSTQFGNRTPVRDLQFVPCVAVAPCRTSLRISGSRTDVLPLVAVAALGDGTALPLVPDATFPAVFRPIDLNDAGPSAGTVSFAGTMPAGEALPTLTVDPASLTDGVTSRETITVTFQGVVPGFLDRRATLSADALEDAVGGFAGPLGARVGDRVSVRFLGAGCPAPTQLEVTSVTDTTLGVSSTAPAACSAVTYSLLAAADQPWVVQGSLSGYLGRAATGAAFEAEGERFYYPPSPVAGSAFAFTIEGAEPTPASRFSFPLASGLSQLLLLEDPDNRRAGLADAVAALPGLVFVASSGDDALAALDLAQQGLVEGTVFFR